MNWPLRLLKGLCDPSQRHSLPAGQAGTCATGVCNVLQAQTLYIGF